MATSLIHDLEYNARLWADVLWNPEKYSYLYKQNLRELISRDERIHFRALEINKQQRKGRKG